VCASTTQSSHVPTFHPLDELKDIGKQNFRRRCLLQRSDQVGDNRCRFVRIGIAFALIAGGDLVFVHHPSDPVLPHLQEHREFAMPQGIILLIQLLDGYRYRFIFAGLAQLPVIARTREVERMRYLTFAIGAVGRGQLAGQFYLLGRR
jgi:hypothetical protein